MVEKMLVIFTALKESSGSTYDIQSRALDNWHEFFPDVKIVKFEGPLIPFSEMVDKVEHVSNADILLYANGDLLFAPNTFCKINGINWPSEALVTGQRIDICKDGMKRLHRPSGMDYFIFRRGMFGDLPRVLMGRAYCDSALVAYCLRKGIPVIDASFALRVEHQFHEYGHVAGGRNQVYKGSEAMANKLNNGLRDLGPNVLDATYTLLPCGSIVPNIRRRPACWGLWNLLTRGGKYWKNPKWDGVAPI